MMSPYTRHHYGILELSSSPPDFKGSKGLRPLYRQRTS